MEGWGHILITSLTTPVYTYRSVEGCDPQKMTSFVIIFLHQASADLLHSNHILT